MLSESSFDLIQGNHAGKYRLRALGFSDKKKMLPMTIGIKNNKVFFNLDALGGKNYPLRVFSSFYVKIRTSKEIKTGTKAYFLILSLSITVVLGRDLAYVMEIYWPFLAFLAC